MSKRVPVIKTARLSLRGIEEADGPLIVRWRSAPGVYQYFTNPHPITSEEHINWFRNDYCLNENRLDWLAEDETELAAGLFSLRRQGPASQEAEVSYLLAPEAQHRGYAQEAVGGVLQWAVKGWGLKRAVATIHRNNAASLLFIARMGFQRVGAEGDFELYKKTL